ncbi:MAG: hypothetical protein PHT75_00005 [Bacilli bacterium]|nr:hypothetical protein [Bacilli bacterium]
MVKIYKEIIKELNNRGIKQFVQNEESFRETYDNIISVFAPFFTNTNNLKHFSFDFLIHDYIQYNILYYPNIKDDIIKVISIYNNAKSINSVTTYKFIADLQSKSIELGNKYWTFIKEGTLPSDSYDYIVKCFKNIEDISEGIMKTSFKIILHLSDIISKTIRSFDEIEKMTFGSLYMEIINKNLLNSIFNIEKIKINVNQWRNISCHNDYQIIDDKIYCKYGKNKEKELVISGKEELYQIARKIYTISSLFNFAFKFFTYDNAEEIKKEMAIDNCVEKARKETDELLITTELYMRGLEILDIKYYKKKISLTVRDLVISDDERKRIIFTSQFLIKIYLLYKKDIVEIIYKNITSKKVVKIWVGKEILAQIVNGEKDMLYLAEHFQFKFE